MRKKNLYPLQERVDIMVDRRNMRQGDGRLPLRLKVVYKFVSDVLLYFHRLLVWLLMLLSCS